MTLFSETTFADQKQNIVRQNHGRFEINLFLTCFIKRTKLQEPFISASTLPK